jgi:methyltransferase OMS1
MLARKLMYNGTSSRTVGLTTKISVCSAGVRHMTSSSTLLASGRTVKIRPRPVTGPVWIRKIKLKWRQIDEDPVKRKKVAMSVILFYIVTGFFGFRYLQDTKHRATGEPNPYKQKLDEQNINSSSAIVEPRDTTEVYEALAAEYDNKIWLEELASYIWYIRRKVMSTVEGDALEVSCGTGRNIKYFNPKTIGSITFVDTSEAMLEVTKRKFQERFPDYEKVQYVKGRAEDLVAIAQESGQKFDTIFETFGLCSHQNPDAALENFRQLLKPGGRIVLLEHGRSTYQSINDRMDRTAEQRAQEWGCRWNLDIDNIVRKSGLKIIDQTRYHFGTTYYYVLQNGDSN